MRKYICVALLIILIAPFMYGLERITMKSNQDRYTGNFVMMDREKVVFLLFDRRFEFTHDEIASISFEDTEDEFEILLDDNSVLKGMIVEQDDDYYTIGSSAGLTTIEKARIVSIKNPKFERYFAAEKVVTSAVNTGIVPATTWILNDIGSSYQPYGSLEYYLETDFGTPVLFGIDTAFMMCLPTFGDFSDFLIFIPVHLYIKYLGRFNTSGSGNDVMSKLTWYIKLGTGCAPAFLLETAEGLTSFALSFSNVLDIGVKYMMSDGFFIGIAAKTNLIVQKNSYAIIQSGGFILDFRL
ncbi:MAG: hypothetical protein JW881_10260 [Spirochaetales bacterium]|nr:hypothetical protein [Spirochaetales bacterium]